MNTKLTVTGALLIIGLTISVIMLFSQNSALKNELDLVSKNSMEETESLDERLKTLETFKVSVSQEVDSLVKQGASYTEELRNLSAAQDQGEKRLDGLRNDLIEAAESSMTPEVIAKASDKALNSIMNKKSLLSNQEFIDHVAQGLAKNHRDTLQGETGVDADNEVVAKLLITDKQFIDRVSVSLLSTE